MANIITGIRIVLSIALLFFPALSPAFFVLYVAGGLSDMIDSVVARRTGTVSEFGSRLDTTVLLLLVKLRGENESRPVLNINHRLIPPSFRLIPPLSDKMAVLN